MSRRRRQSRVELNFDGLTDSVTNLVGALILLVVLIVGVTREAVSRQKETPKPKTGKKNAGEKSIKPLQDRVNQMKAQLRDVDNDIEGQKRQLRSLREEVQDLIKKAEKIKKPLVVKNEEKKEPPRKQKYRLPLQQFRTKKHITFVVEDSTITFMDWDALNTELRKIVAGKSGRVDVNFEVPGTIFVVSGSLNVGERGYSNVNVKATRKKGTKGDSLDAALKTGSKFHKQIGTVDPSTHVVRFLVYPDSFDAFRKLRAVAFQKKFEVGWQIQKNGEIIRLGRGGGGTEID